MKSFKEFREGMHDPYHPKDDVQNLLNTIIGQLPDNQLGIFVAALARGQVPGIPAQVVQQYRDQLNKTSISLTQYGQQQFGQQPVY